MNNKYMIFRRVIYPFRHLRTFSSAKRILSNKKYLPSEEWLLKRMDSRKGWILEMGISQKAMEQFNELIYLEYQFDEGDIIEKDEELVLLESVKASESINSPFKCELIENNIELDGCLCKLNKDPENIWIVKIKEIKEIKEID